MTDTAEARNASALGSLSELAVSITKNFGAEFSLDIACTFEPGITIVFGPSGAGKTTLLDCIAGLTPPNHGRIAIGPRVLFASEIRRNTALRHRNVGYVFQDLALFPHLSAEQNIAYSLNAVPAGERRARVNAILESFRIGHLRARKPGEISGGERQRVALARSLVTNPSALLLDEPLAALDARTKSAIIEDLRAWNETHRVPILYVTHSREEVFALGERVIVVEHGRVIADGTPHEVMSAPMQETVAQLAGFENVFDTTAVALHENQGSMTCRLGRSTVELETPLVRAEVGSMLRVGIRAGDILLAVEKPRGLSARNVIEGRIVSLEQRDVIVVARVDCGVEMEVHLTIAAREALSFQPGKKVWLVVKTHSCHLMRG